MTKIARDAFEYCKSLTSIELPAGVTVITRYAFNGCTSLKDVYYGGNEASWKAIDIGDYNEPLINAIIHYEGDGSGRDGLKWNINANGLLSISGTGKMADYHDPDAPAPWSGQRDQIKTITISQGVTSIGTSAFAGCTNLTYVTIPKFLVSIGDSAFSGCEKLAHVSFLGTEEEWRRITVGNDNAPFQKAPHS